MSESLRECLHRGKLVVEFDGDDYLKAYVHPAEGIVSYGFRGRTREAIWQALRDMVEQYIEANLEEVASDD